MAYPSTLPSLTTREAITDAIYRAVLGLDTANLALFDSAFTQDASFDLNGKVLSGLDKIHTDCYDGISKLDTTHFISNVRVNVKDGENKASMTASALAQHYRTGQGSVPGSPRLLSGSLYDMDCVKDDKDGLWKMTSWRMKIIWTEGDFKVITEP